MSEQENLGHWRDTARSARFFIVDYRACFALLILMFLPNKITFIACMLVLAFFCLLEQLGFTIPVFFRWLRVLLAGKHRYSKPWWYKERRES
jgi:intracellular multiplication protein IcmT